MWGGAPQETSYSLQSYSFGVGAVSAGSRGISVCFEGLWILATGLEEAPWVLWAADKATPGKRVEIPYPLHPLSILAGLPHSGRLPASYFRRAPG